MGTAVDVPDQKEAKRQFVRCFMFIPFLLVRVCPYGFSQTNPLLSPAVCLRHSYIYKTQKR